MSINFKRQRLRNKNILTFKWCCESIASRYFREFTMKGWQIFMLISAGKKTFKLEFNRYLQSRLRGVLLIKMRKRFTWRSPLIITLPIVSCSPALIPGDTHNLDSQKIDKFFNFLFLHNFSVLEKHFFGQLLHLCLHKFFHCCFAFDARDIQ